MRMRLCSILAIVMLPAFAQDTAAPASPSEPASPAAAPAMEAPVQEDDGYGMSKALAIEVCYPQGQREYLARLVCPDGAHPDFERAGNVGMRTPLPEDLSDAQIEALLSDMRSPDGAVVDGPDLHIVDAYEVTCGEQRTRLYLDMYHCAADRQTRAPKGFTILD